MSAHQQKAGPASRFDTGPYLRQEGRLPPGLSGESASTLPWSMEIGRGNYNRHRRPRAVFSEAARPDAGHWSSTPGLPSLAAWLMDRIRQTQ